MTEKIYTSLYLIALLVTACSTYYLSEYVGELSGIPLGVSKIEIFWVLMFSIISIFLSYFLYFSLIKPIRISNFYFYVNEFKFSILFLILVVLSNFFLLATGVGRLFSNATSPWSPLFNLFLVDALFYVYYFLFRKGSHKVLFFINVILFVILKILQGWTGILLFLVFFELYFYSKRYKNPNKIGWFSAFLLSTLILLLGAFAYKYMYPIKNSIRGFDVGELTYGEALVKLTTRLTYFPVALGVYEKDKGVVDAYQNENIDPKEALASLRPLLPRFIFQDKEFRSLNNNSKQPFFDNGYSSDASTDIGIMMYGYILFSASYADFIIWLLSVCILFLLMKFIYDSFEIYRGQLSFLLFLLIFDVFYTASVEVVYTSVLIKIIFFIPFLWGMGIIKIYKRCNCRNYMPGP